MPLDFITQMHAEQKNVVTEEDATVGDLRRKVGDAWGGDGFQMSIASGMLDKDDLKLSECSIEGDEVIEVSVCPKKAAVLLLKEMGVTTDPRHCLVLCVAQGAAEMGEDGKLKDEELFEKFELCLQSGLDIDTQDNEGRPLLTVAAAQGKADTVQYLIDKEADVSYVANDPSGGGKKYTALLSAARKGHRRTCEVLLDARPKSIDDVDHNKQTPLHIASELGRLAVIDVLVNHKDVTGMAADVNAKDVNGMTPLMLASRHGHVEAAQKLIFSGAEVNYTTPRSSALKVAAMKGSAEMIKVLCAAGAEVNTLDDLGKSAVWYAAASGHVDALTALIRMDEADINQPDNRKYTPLMCAVASDKVDAVRALVNAGADVSLKQLNGQTALQLAEMQPVDEITEILRAATSSRQ